MCLYFITGWCLYVSHNWRLITFHKEKLLYYNSSVKNKFLYCCSKNMKTSFPCIFNLMLWIAYKVSPMFPFSKSNHGSPQPSEFCMKIRLVWYSEFFIKHILCRIILRSEDLFVHVVHAEYGQGWQGCSDPPSETWINFVTYKTDWSQKGTVGTTEPPGRIQFESALSSYLPTVSYL